MSAAGASVPPGSGARAGTGLSAAEVRERTLAGLNNGIPDATSRSLWQILRANVLTLLNGIVGGCFLLLLLLGQWRDALFGFAAVSNAIIGVVQEYRAKQLLDRLAILDAPRARVLRDGHIQEIAPSDLVMDDVAVLQAGDQVVADAVILEDDGLELDESLLTGESDAVGKRVGATVLSGSTVTAGHGLAQVAAVGAGSYASRLTAEAKRFSLVHSEIRNGVARVLRWISWALLPLVAIVVNGQMHAKGGWEAAIRTGAWLEALVGAVGAAIAMIPLGLVLMTSVAFAVGGVRLARQQVLVQELAAVEGLARVDVLCIDKTGTLSLPTAGSLLPPSFLFPPSGSGARPAFPRQAPAPGPGCWGQRTCSWPEAVSQVRTCCFRPGASRRKAYAPCCWPTRRTLCRTALRRISSCRTGSRLPSSSLSAKKSAPTRRRPWPFSVGRESP